MFKDIRDYSVGVGLGEKSEKKETEKLEGKEKEFLNLLIEEYKNPESLKTDKYVSDYPLDNESLTKNKLEEAWRDLGYDHVTSDDFEPACLVNEKAIMNEIRARIVGESTPDDKIVLMQILYDVNKGLIIGDPRYETVKKNLDFLRELYIDKDTPFLLKTFIKNKINDCLSYVEVCDEFFYEEIIDEYGTMFDFKNKITDYNIPLYDKVKYKFSLGMKNQINEARHDDYYRDDLFPIKEAKIDEDHEDFDSVDNYIYIKGDYITSQVSPGAIGVYSREGGLVGWKDEKIINDFQEGDDQIDLEVPEDLYKKFKALDSEESPLLFKMMLSLSFRKALEEKIGLDVAELDIKNQLYFLNFIKNNTEEEVDRVAKFLDSGKGQDSKLDRLKSFLSLEADKNNGERILEIGNKLAPEKADIVFGKVAEFNDILVRANENLSKYFYKENEKRDFDEFRESLLKKMHQIIFDFSDNLEAGKKKSDEDVSVLLDDLSKANSDIEILSAFLGSLDESERFEQLEKVKDLAIEKTNKLSDEEINKIATLAEASWSENVQERQVNEKFMENLLKSLRSGLENLTEADEMNILKYKEEIVGVIKFKRKENGALEAESVNVNPEVKGLNIGKFIFEIIKQKAEKDDIYLYGCVKTKVVSHYVNELGAVGYGFNDDDLDADEPSLRMKIAKTNHEKTESSNSFDIERKFRINDPKELLEFREFLKENLFATDNDGELVEDQNSNEKYSVVKFDWEGDDKKTAHVFLKKNE